MKPTVFIAGHFPPPLTGQSIATARIASLIEEEFTPISIPLNAQAQVKVRTSARFSAFTDALRARKDLKTQFAQHQPIAVVWPSISPQIPGHLRDQRAILANIPASVPVVGVSHWGNFEVLFKRTITRRSGARKMQRLAKMVFNTLDLARRCATWVPQEKQAIIPNTVDAAILCSDEEIAAKWADPPQDRPIRVLFLSNMLLSKGYLDTMEAVRLLHEKGLKIQAKLAGAWPEDLDRKGAESFIVGNGLTEVIELLGPVTDRSQVKALHLEADVLAFPTYYRNEAHPVVIPEALNAGTPIISTRHASIPEMIRDKQDGHLVPRKDPAALASAIEMATRPQYWLSLSKNARERFHSVFSPEVVGRLWRELIRDVANL